MTITFPTVAGRAYHLQVNPNLATTNWTDTQVYTGDGSTQTNLITPALRGFYRLYLP